MTNYRPDVPLVQAHIFDLPQMCPVSHNPQPGSTLTVRYAPADVFLEIEGLHRYIQSFVGGKWEGGTFVRDMEQTIQTIAAHCRAAVGVPVTVEARLRITMPAGEQRMELLAQCP